LQGQKLKELNMTSKQNADAIKQFEDEISNYHILIKNMNNTIKENAQIFINLDLEYKELLKQIEELSESKQEKDEYIVQLLNNIKGQDDKITELSSIIEINSDKILRMNATIEEQIHTINSLETSLDDKNKMIDWDDVKQYGTIGTIVVALVFLITSGVGFGILHYVLDQTGSKVIKTNRVPTYIVGSLRQIDNILRGKKFIGTIIKG